jgi:hypothetical protein
MLKKDNNKERVFMKQVEKGEFNFSYSSLNRLIFSPSLFYKDYILKDREIRTDKHLIEGKLIHLLLLQPEEFDQQFALVPGKIPSDAVRRVLNQVMMLAPLPLNSGDPEVEENYKDPKLTDLDELIIKSLKDQNLYQSMKDEAKKLAKIQTLDNETYFTFLMTCDGKDIIDQDMYNKCLESVELIKNNKSVMDLLSDEPTDFEMDGLEVYNEAPLQCELDNYKFGLKGIVDRYVINHDKKEIKIIDLKTTGKSISDFPETVEFYNYWLQAAIYVTLIAKNHVKKEENYQISFNFIVIDKYSQVYNFPVKTSTMSEWGDAMLGILEMAKYHVEENKYELPYDFLTKTISL